MNWSQIVQTFIINLPSLLTSLAILLCVVRVLRGMIYVTHLVNSQQEKLNEVVIAASRAQGVAEGEPAQQQRVVHER